MPEERIEGVAHFFSETGTEGGLWALQDQDYIEPNETRFTCVNCYLYWDKEKYPESPPRHIQSQPLNEVDLKTDVNDVFPEMCPPGECNFEPVSDETWYYEGLHILSDGDYLIIYDKEDSDSVVWEGEISLVDHPVFTESVFGLWIHSDQEGVDRERWARWFINRHPATLVKSDSE